MSEGVFRPLTERMDLSHEESIVWVRGGPDDYPYLRERGVVAHSRRKGLSRSIKWVVAYSILQANAPHIYGALGRGKFERRYWSFEDSNDRYPSERADPEYEIKCPYNGVKPRSIMAGRQSETGRQ